VYLLVFHAYINEMQVQDAKYPVKISSGSVARRDLIGRVMSSDVVRAHHVTRHNTPIHNILSTAPQPSISQKALGTLPEDGN
jgi:tRNA pseudouridine-54 N-methylase